VIYQSPEEYNHKFKAFVGKGNNSLLVKSLIKRRSSWWTFTEKYEEANLIWTQIKIPEIFRGQKGNNCCQKYPLINL
jgi:hypothetical protein